MYYVSTCKSSGMRYSHGMVSYIVTAVCTSCMNSSSWQVKNRQVNERIGDEWKSDEKRDTALF